MFMNDHNIRVLYGNLESFIATKLLKSIATKTALFSSTYLELNSKELLFFILPNFQAFSHCELNKAVVFVRSKVALYIISPKWLLCRLSVKKTVSRGCVLLARKVWAGEI